MLEPPPGLLDRARQHAARLPSPLLHQLAGRFARARVARGAGPVRAHPERVLRGAARAFRACSACTTSTPRSRGVGAQRSGLAWLREQNRAAALRVVERRVLPRADRVLCVSEADADAVLRRRRARAAGAQRRRRRVLRRRRARRAASARCSSAHFGYEANRRGRRALPRRGLAARSGARARTRGWRSPAAGWTTRCARGSTRSRASRCSASSPTCPALLAAARAVVVPIWEGGGTRLKVLEALAAGRAVVATPLGASGVGFERRQPRAARRSARGAGGGAGRAARRPAAGGDDGRRGARCWPSAIRWPEALAGASAFYCAGRRASVARTFKFEPDVEPINGMRAHRAPIDKGKPVVRRGRKATGPLVGVGRAAERGTWCEHSRRDSSRSLLAVALLRGPEAAGRAGRRPLPLRDRHRRRQRRLLADPRAQRAS